jgi:hypothetical protein
MKYSKGIMWLDDCRIPYLNGVENEFSETYLRSGNSKSKGDDLVFNISGNKREGVYVNDKGRFSPNLLVCDDMLNDGSVSKSQKTNGINVGRFPNTIKTGVEYQKEYERGFTDKGTNSRYYDLDIWFNKLIDEINYVL